MEQRNAISVSWGDHLLFGEDDGRLDTPVALKRRMQHWRDELGGALILWRERRTRLSGHFYAARGYKNLYRRKVSWDDFRIVPDLSHELGMEAYLYVSLFDEGWPLLPQRIREISYHNAMHFQHVSFQTRFSRQHPEYTVVDRTGLTRQWGVLCLAYPEVRSHFRERYLALLNGYQFDGLFVCLRSQSRPADFADQFGFNEPIRNDYLSRFGKDILKEDFDLQKWRDLQGEYLTLFLRELRPELKQRGTKLAIGAPRGDIIGPPLGNWTLHWRDWVREGLIDDLIINQNSSQCPSMWHQLWPMHRGYGYLQNYLDGYNMPPLLEQVDSIYRPVMEKSGTNLFVARQWVSRDADEEQGLLANPCVKGLVFGSFRFDNPAAIERGDWRL